MRLAWQVLRSNNEGHPQKKSKGWKRNDPFRPWGLPQSTYDVDGKSTMPTIRPEGY